MLIRGYRFVTIALLPSRCRIVTPARHPLYQHGARYDRTLGPRGSDKGPLSASGQARMARGLAPAPALTVK